MNCTCEAKTEILSKETVKTFAKQFKNTLSNSNFKVIQCIGNVFSIDIFTNNVGNYFMVFMILCNISCLLFYIIYGIDNLKKTMYLSLFGNDISNPPNRSDEDAICDVSPVISKCKTAKSHFSRTNFVMKPTLRKKGTYNMVEKNTSLTNSAEFKSSHDLADIHNDSTSIAQIPKYDKYEINYIKHEEAVKYDKRTKMSMFLSILVLKHPLIYAFFINDKYTIKSISISMFIISEQMGLAFNALFYTDGYISNDGFIMGCVFLIKLFDIEKEIDSIHWFDYNEEKFDDDNNNEINKKKAEVFKALSNPVRLDVIDQLLDGEKCVCEIQKALSK